MQYDCYTHISNFQAQVEDHIEIGEQIDQFEIMEEENTYACADSLLGDEVSLYYNKKSFTRKIKYWPPRTNLSVYWLAMLNWELHKM